MPDSSRTSRIELEETLRRAAKGEQEAWRILVEDYTRRVFGLLRTHCNDDELAEEITQSTFCTIAAKLESYTELGRFEQWLFRIAMNRLRDEMRRRKRHAVPVENPTLIGLAGADEAQSSDALSPAEGGVLSAAIAQLPGSDQQVIHLRHQGQLSFKQIAEVLDEPLGTILARHHRALKKLREILERAGLEE